MYNKRRKTTYTPACLSNPPCLLCICGRQFPGTEMKCHLENYTFKYRKIHKIICSTTTHLSKFFNLEIYAT